MVIRSVAVWGLLMMVAIANGAFREGFLVPRIGGPAAHLLSTAMLCAAILLVTAAWIRWIRPEAASLALRIGALWLALVLAFEFGFGHFVAGKPWSALLADYDLARGRFWLAVPLVTAAAPLLAARWRKLF